MKIGDVVLASLKKIGREDVAADLESGGEATGDDGEIVNTLLYCVNAVEDELARYYFPLTATEKLQSESGEYSFADFTYIPVKILSVKRDGKKVKFTLDTGKMITDCKEIEVEYGYAPKKKTMDDESAFGDELDVNIAACGAAAEFCLISGETSLAEVWETRYREGIERAQKLYKSRIYIPPRRWV